MIEFHDVTKRYPNGYEALRNVSLRIESGAMAFLTGHSGAGKSTLLRLTTLLERCTRGQVLVGGHNLSRLSRRRIPYFRRNIGVVFQNHRLLMDRTVFDNVALPLREHTKLSETVIAGLVRAQFEAVGLDGVDSLLPGQLSGGMTKRVALARAMITEPEILLCDEPFSGLDPPNVDRIEGLFKELCEQRGLTLIVTSHHMASSLRMSDQIVLLRDGRAVTGTPGSLATSGDPEITDFLGADGASLARQVAAGGAS